MPMMGMDLWNQEPDPEDAVCTKHEGPHEMDTCPLCEIDNLTKALINKATPDEVFATMGRMKWLEMQRAALLAIAEEARKIIEGKTWVDEEQLPGLRDALARFDGIREPK